MKQKLLHIFLNQYVIAGLIALGIIYILPGYFNKYKVELVEQDKVSKSKVFYEDLDNDNKSEKILYRKNTADNASMMIYASNGDLLDQWNYNSNILNDNDNRLWFFDLNNNGFKEIYSITKKVDSVFLNILEPLVKNGIDRKHIFLDTIVPFNKEYTVYPSDDALRLDSKKEIVFALTAGYSGYPRRLYKYNFTTNTVLTSAHLTNPSNVNEVTDLNNNGASEILLSSHSAGNTIDSIYTKRSDYSSWLMVLDSDLSFLFEPIEIKSEFSGLNNFSFKKNGEKKILTYFNSKQMEVLPPKLLVTSLEGVIEKEHILANGRYRLFKNPDNNEELYVYNRDSGLLLVLDYYFKEHKTYNLGTKNDLSHFDIDGDGAHEWIKKSYNNYSISIHSKNFTNELKFSLPSTSNIGVAHSFKKINDLEHEILFQKGDEYYVYNYSENQYYLLKYPFYLCVYGIVMALVLLIAKGQKIRLEKQQAITNKISELQIKTIKNQVDPHFVFNAINTISEMTLMDNKLEADRFISHFSKFMRNTLMHSDKISTTLKEELDYVENFIKLQRIRYSNKFDYIINISKNVDVKTIVPKHVLFTYVENAIKHGLALKENGLLQIVAKIKKGKLSLSIEDNGLGMRSIKQNKKESTGSGLGIMEQIYDLYAKLYKRKISHSIIELKDAENNKAGLRVEVLIENKK